MPGFLSDHVKVKNYVEEFDSLKQISEYRASGLYHSLPINSKYAFWGGGLAL